jgi:hypothetical protein
MEKIPFLLSGSFKNTFETFEKIENSEKVLCRIPFDEKS